MDKNVKFDAVTVTHFMKLDTTIKTLSKEYNTMKQGYKEYLIDNGLSEKDCGLCIMKVSEYEKDYIDSEYLKTHYPEVWEDCVRTRKEKRFTF